MQLPIVCRYTGIQATIDMPSLGNKCLEFTHPLSHIDSVVDVITTRDYPRKLDKTVLAGCLITILRHTKLLESKNHPAAINVELSKAKKSYLLKACELGIEYLTGLRTTKFLPKVSIEYYESEADACLAISAFMGTLISELLDDSDLVKEVNSYFTTRPRATTFHGHRQATALALAEEAMAAKREAQKAHAARLMAEFETRCAAKKAAKAAKASEKAIQTTVKSCAPRGLLYNLAIDAGAPTKRLSTLGQYLTSAHILEKQVLEQLATKVQERIDDNELGANSPAITRYYNAALEVINHYIAAQASNSLTTSDLLETLDPEPAVEKKLTLKERLAALKGGAK